MNKQHTDKTTMANLIKLILLFGGIFLLVEFVFPYLHIGITIAIIVVMILTLMLLTILKLRRDADAEIKALKILNKDNNPGGYIEEMQHILEANPQKAQDYNFNMNLATGHYRNGDTQRAFEMYKQLELDTKALKHSQFRAALYSSLCECYLAQDNIELAEVYYNKCITEEKHAKHTIPHLDERFKDAKVRLKNKSTET